jgi:glycosyltransferase involved in cell wall biosynthesis
VNVLVINQFACTPQNGFGAGERHYNIANKLASSNFNFKIISGSYNHLMINPPKANNLISKEKIDGGEFIWIKLKKYNTLSYLGRIYSWFEFLSKLFFLPLREVKNQDVIIVSSMTLWPILYAFLIKAIFKIPVLLEIRDIWPLSIVQEGKVSENNHFVRFFTIIEKFAYKKSDLIISTLPHLDKHVENVLGYSIPVKWIPNAIDFPENTQIVPTSIKLPEGKFIIAYTGALGIANSMSCFIETAMFLKSREEFIFVIVGDGYEKDKLKIKATGFNNILFFNGIKKKEVLVLLKQVDLCFISWHNYKMYNYGVSANKYNDYMLACKPVISASNITDDPVIMANCGYRVESGNAKEISEAILKLYNMPNQQRELLGKNGLEYVLRNNTYQVISEKYAQCLRQVVKDFKHE